MSTTVDYYGQLGLLLFIKVKMSTTVDIANSTWLAQFVKVKSVYYCRRDGSPCSACSLLKVRMSTTVGIAHGIL